jgi:hypothetical protein
MNYKAFKGYFFGGKEIMYDIQIEINIFRRDFSPF